MFFFFFLCIPLISPLFSHQLILVTIVGGPIVAATMGVEDETGDIRDCYKASVDSP